MKERFALALGHGRNGRTKQLSQKAMDSNARGRSHVKTMILNRSAQKYSIGLNLRKRLFANICRGSELM